MGQYNKMFSLEEFFSHLFLPEFRVFKLQNKTIKKDLIVS